MSRLILTGKRDPDPEDKLFASMPASLSKGSKVAILKSQGVLKQAGRHLVPTAKGRKAIAKRKR